MRKSDFVSRIFAHVGVFLFYIVSCRSGFDFEVNRAEKNVKNGRYMPLNSNINLSQAANRSNIFREPQV